MNSSFSKKLGLISVVFFVLNGLPYEGKAWGFFMHKKINSHAIYLLPPELITLYKNNEFTLKVYATKPDNRRYIDPKEGPRHFIDLDTYDAIDSGFIGLNYSAAKDLYNQCVEDHHEFGQDGILPWHCLLMIHELTEAMKGGHLEDILHISGELGHYISDAHVPLHTTLNYNGQRSGQHGIHGLWESTIPELELSNMIIRLTRNSPIGRIRWRKYGLSSLIVITCCFRFFLPSIVCQRTSPFQSMVTNIGKEEHIEPTAKHFVRAMLSYAKITSRSVTDKRCTR